MTKKLSSGCLRDKRIAVLRRLHDRMQADLNGSRLSLQQRPFVKAQQNALEWALSELDEGAPKDRIVSSDLRAGHGSKA